MGRVGERQSKREGEGEGGTECNGGAPLPELLVAVSTMGVSSFASAAPLAVRANWYAGRGFGRIGAVVGFAVSLDASGNKARERGLEGLGIDTSIATIDVSLRGDTVGSMSSMNDGEENDGEEKPLATEKLLLRLRRGGVRAGGTAAVRSAVDGSFVTSARTVLV